ncbi:MAG: SMP-30/gluconolactonase/LRE family protein [Rubrobacter sp.]|jgi:Cu-Zn family superoxide dismutase|nr:SMP-30/gluconolactonase/LRE family protein [Rubrobacter sp.]
MIEGPPVSGASPANTHDHPDAGKGTRRKARLLVFLALGLALTACGGVDQETQEGSASGAPASKEPASGEGTASGGTTTKEVSTEETAADHDSATRTFALPGERAFPEGVAYDPASEDFFVGNSEDGTIYRSNVGEGPKEAEVFLEGRTDGRSVVYGMKVDERGRLFVAGGGTGRAFVYDAASGDLIEAFDTAPNGETLMNDVTVTRDAAYFTDSFRTTLFRVPLTADGVGEIEPWLDLEGTPIEYEDGENNLDGIAASPDGRYLIAAQPTTRGLYRIDTRTEQVTSIDLGGESLSAVNGIWLDGRTLYAASDETDEILPVELSEDFASGAIGEPFTDPSVEFPTTIAKHDNRLLVVNHQVEGEPLELPFTVSDVQIPAHGDTASAKAASGETAAARTFSLPGGAVFPEGVAYDPATGDFFVGSTRSGAVYRGNVRVGSGEMEVFLEGGADGRGGVTGMKVDREGRLWISGRDSGRAYVYDAGSGELIKVLETPRIASTLINDVTVTEDAAYFTDSFRTTLFRVPLTPGGVGEMEPWLDFGETPISYREGFNLNGITATEDGRFLITVQFNTGRLYRIDTETREITEIDLGGETLKTGDGLLLDGRTLYVVRESPGEIVPVRLSEDFASGTAGEAFSDPSFRFPTTIAGYEDRLLVVNSQLNTTRPKLPFTVSSVPIP